MKPTGTRRVRFTATLAPWTIARYQGHLRVMAEHLRRNEVFDKAFFLRFVYALSAAGRSSRTATAYRSAVVFAQLAYQRWLDADGKAWAKDEDVVRACKGCGHIHATPVLRPRGAVTLSMLMDVLWRAQPGQLLSRCLRLIYWGALRLAEFRALRCGDLFDLNGEQRVTLRVDKRFRIGGRINVHKHSRRVLPEFVELFRKLAGQRHAEELLCPKHVDDDDLRSVIRRGPSLCGWSAELQYDGVHCLRHGHAVDFDSDPQLKERMNATQQTADYYAKSNDFRTQAYLKALQRSHHRK